MFHFRLNEGPNIWAHGFRGDQFHRPLEPLLQEEGQLDEIIKRLATGFKLHQKVHITIRAGFPPDQRAKEAQPFHTQSPYLGLIGL